jgi:hypothetical protein
LLLHQNTHTHTSHTDTAHTAHRTPLNIIRNPPTQHRHHKTSYGMNAMLTLHLLLRWLLFLASSHCEVIQEWNDIAKFLSHDKYIRNFATNNARWRYNFTSALSLRTTGIFGRKRPKEIVFYPFSGGDVLTPLALNTHQRQVKHIVLTSQEPAVVVPHRNKHKYYYEHAPDLLEFYRNETLLMAAREASAQVLRTSGGGYLLGHVVRKFASEFGMLPLLLASLGTVKNMRVKQVVPQKKGLQMFCCQKRTTTNNSGQNERSNCFYIHYLAVNLHHSKALQFLDSKLRALELPVTTVLKAVDEGGLLTHTAGQGSTWEVARQKAALNLAAWLVNISSTVIQDVTGVHIDSLLSMFGYMDLYGVYLSPCEDVRQLQPALEEANDVNTTSNSSRTTTRTSNTSSYFSKERALEDVFFAASHRLPAGQVGKNTFDDKINFGVTMAWHNIGSLHYGHCMIPWPCHAAAITRFSSTSVNNSSLPAGVLDTTPGLPLVPVRIHSDTWRNHLCHFVVATNKRT